MVTESGGDETGDETRGPGGFADKTDDKTAATAGDERDSGDRWSNVCGRRSVYNRRPPSLFGDHCEILRWRTLRKTLKRWWERLEKWRVRRRRRLVTNETATIGGVMYTDEGELKFDEDEMAALEGQRLVAEFRCGIY